MEHWQNITCLNFEKKTEKPKGNRIVFTDVDGCASNVGRHPLGEPQFVSIAPECLRVSILHYLPHPTCVARGHTYVRLSAVNPRLQYYCLCIT